jgi:hypothetical protein
MANVGWTRVDPVEGPTLTPGDHASSEAGGLPIYEVLSIAKGRAWVRDLRTGDDRIVPDAVLRWRMTETAR